jgi:hypothetical protein
VDDVEDQPGTDLLDLLAQVQAYAAAHDLPDAGYSSISSSRRRVVATRRLS